MSRQHSVSIAQAVLNFRRNRREFYETLLPRIPSAELGRLLRVAAEAWEDPTEVARFPELDEDDHVCSGLAAEMLRLDLLKKEGFGRIFGRTVVSFYEALERARRVEETGALFFDELARLGGEFSLRFQAEGNARREALARLIRLEDDLRYHRIGAA